MKVLIYIQYWKKGGIERLISYLAEEFAEHHKGYQLSVLTEDVPDPAEQYNLPRSVPIYFRDFTPFHEENRLALRKQVTKINPDVVVAMSSTRAIYKIPRALVGLPYPVVLSEHNTNTEISRSFYNDYRFYNAVRNLADINHFIFEGFSKGYLQRDKVRVISNPIVELTEKADVSDNNPNNRIINIARYHLHQKQQDLLIKSFALVADKHPDWTLDLYGGDWRDGKAKLRALIDELSLHGRVYLNDAIDNVGEVLAGGKIFAFPSAYEGFGLVAGEALSVGLPVIAFQQCDGVNQFIIDGENGLLVEGEVDDTRAFADGLNRLMSNEDERVKMSRAAVSSIANFSMSKFISGWKSIFDEAYLRKGHNTLINCSPMELDYIDLVASGKMFDEAHQHDPLVKRVNQLKEKVAKLRIEGLLRRILTLVR